VRDMIINAASGTSQSYAALAANSQ
jgi:hypothetical protein